MNTSIGPVVPLDFKSPAPINASDQAIWEGDNWPTGCVLNAVVFAGFGMVWVNYSERYLNYEAHNWTTPFVDWYRDLQLLSLIQGMAESLAGSVALDQTCPR
jgi:hypothetical protein